MCTGCLLKFVRLNYGIFCIIVYSFMYLCKLKKWEAKKYGLEIISIVSKILKSKWSIHQQVISDIFKTKYGGIKSKA